MIGIESIAACIDQPGLIEAMQNLIGGAATTLAAAFAGRAMFHAREVRVRRRV